MIKIQDEGIYKIIDITKNDEMAAIYEVNGHDHCAIDDQIRAQFLGWA